MAKKALDLNVIHMDQRELADVHLDCFMKAIDLPRSPMPLKYTEEVARLSFQFEEDTSNVKMILGHRKHRRRLLFRVRWEG